jgi:ATP-dependent Clp protease ATP-binding subunit ClpA
MNPMLSGWLLRFVILGAVLALIRYSHGLTLVGVAMAWVLLGALVVLEILNLNRYLPRFSAASIGRAAMRSEGREGGPTSATKPEQLAAALKERVYGQDQVIDEMTRTLRRRLIAKRSNRPVAVFCFLGAPGVGKTYLAKALTEVLYQDLRHLHVIDAGHSSATALFGQPGSESYGALTTALRSVPNSIILIAQFGKASAEVQKRFLTAWNEGFVTESSDGTNIAANEAIFILTFDSSTRQIEELARNQADASDAFDRAVRSALIGAEFQPEALSRIDEVFIFRELQGLDIARVIALEIENIAKQYDLQIAGSGIDPAILMDAIDKVTGAAGNVRAVSRYIEKQIADGLVDAKAAGATHVRLTREGGKTRVTAVDDGDAPSSHRPASVPA